VTSPVPKCDPSCDPGSLIRCLSETAVLFAICEDDTQMPVWAFGISRYFRLGDEPLGTSHLHSQRRH
jgi:hypothetical protein